ncbi:BMP family lipoprotein [Allonocardiopsis opalescens]
MRRVRMTKLASVAMAGALVMAAAACGGGEGGGTEGGGDGAARVGLAYDIGGRGDRSFNDAAYRGLEQVAEELDLEVQDLAAEADETDADKVARLQLMAEEGYNPIIAVGFAYSGAVAQVAAEYPDVQFAIVDDEANDLPNLTNLVFAEEQASFLAGAAAALATEEDHIGFVGGVENPLIQKFEAGYVAGAQHINPDIQIDIAYITQPPDFTGFTDPARGQAAAQGQYDAGADVVYHAAGASGNGVIDAAVANEQLVIGVDSDQYLTADPEEQPYILTSAVKLVDTAVFEFVQGAVNGTAEGGTVRFDLANEGVGYSRSNTELIGEYEEQLDELQQQIIDGEIEVPTEP